MLNIGAGELTLILVVALLVLGPTRLPEMARGIGKFIREFRRQTDDVRTMVEREFYRLDEDVGTHLSAMDNQPTSAALPAVGEETEETQTVVATSSPALRPTAAPEAVARGQVVDAPSEVDESTQTDAAPKPPAQG